MSFWQEFNERLRAFGLAIGVHVLMAAFVVLGTMSWEPFRKPQNLGLTIEAVIVDTAAIKEQRDAAKQAVEMEDRRRSRAEELERQKQRDLEQKKRREDAAEKRKRDLDAQKKRDAQDRLQKLRMERERKMEDERLKQQRELDLMQRLAEALEAEKPISDVIAVESEASLVRSFAFLSRMSMLVVSAWKNFVKISTKPITLLRMRRALSVSQRSRAISL